MPVTESADNDLGYAVQDYRSIESDYGSMSDFETLLSEAHARGIAIVIDYVMNHAASTNPLFLDASTEAGNDKRDWFVWEDAQPQGWNTFAGNHVWNQLNGVTEDYKLAAASYLLAAQTPFTHYGEEIGMARRATQLPCWSFTAACTSCAGHIH